MFAHGGRHFKAVFGAIPDLGESFTLSRRKSQTHADSYRFRMSPTCGGFLSSRSGYGFGIEREEEFMRSKMLLSVAAAVTALSLGMVACGGDDDDNGNGNGEVAEAEFDLTVGALIPQTGDLSEFAPPGEKAAQLAIEEANTALEEAGTNITASLEVGDTETRPQPAQSAARQLISQGAGCIAGAWASGSTIPVGSSVSARQEVPLISPASTSPEITDLDDNGYVFRTAPSDAFQGQVLADAVGEEIGTDATISVAARNDAYGEGIVRQFIESFEEAGGTTSGPILYDLEAPSYDSEAAQIVSGNPDGYVIVDFEEPYNQLGGALARTGDFDATNLWTADGLAFDEIPGGIPDAALDGASGTRPATPEGTETAQAFDDLYSQSDLSPNNRGTFDAQNFDAVMLCVLAAVAAGSDQGSDIREEIQNVASSPGTEYDYTQLADAITALQDGEEINFQGVSGPIDLDDAGDPIIATYEVFNYQDGELVVDRQVEAEAEDAEATE
jgi:ABC-type branched-subunit amino acid transport system substrate-binding protein